MYLWQWIYESKVGMSFGPSLLRTMKLVELTTMNFANFLAISLRSYLDGKKRNVTLKKRN